MWRRRFEHAVTDRLEDQRTGIGVTTIMPKGLGSTIVKLLIASLLVGLVMRWMGVTPRSLIANFGATVERMYDSLASFAGWAVDYVLVGAVIVVPIWLVVFLLDRIKTKRGS